jgi:hypothetical protein
MTVASPPEPTHWVEVLPPRQEATQAAPAATVPSHGGHRGGTRAVASAAAVSVSMSAPPTALVPRSDSAPSTWGSSLALVPSPPDEERSPAAEGLVRQAQRELPSNPARALDLALRDEGISGGLVEERDVVIIRALVRLGRAEEARERAARFLRVYPRSEHRGEIAALFGFDPGRQNL